ncbi:glycoside hydrolase family 5 protein [Macrolepiota fuliginosa MF-IS2]|uniref:mannan endo-1,4-beta-mannosidase n=1 Tax=Macrolepiota fuliginosa MF-IS2 TaxID=1400762 RepID=A0A9P6C7B9_9AGAR|nr:glycoside hydrolase family 5 protein [Macrolepiota fuliginosa MF-IS2]
MRVLSSLTLLVSLLSLNVFARSTTTVNGKRNNDKNHFVKQQGTQLMVNGSEFKYLGTTAYWLSSLNSDEDINATLGNISQAGFNAVRTWAFNDVDTIPENGTWFQTIQNGTAIINNGTNGLQKLDKVMELAQNHGIYVLLSLTNNWNPRPTDNINVTDPLNAFRFGTRDVLTNNSLPRGALSNDYGGMDFYVRQLGGTQEHDQFFTNQTLIDAFKNYTTHIVTRYANHPNVLAWELANDPRCNSSINASVGCVAQNVTRWHSTLAQHVSNLDPNHIVATGHQGFFCTGCPKLFFRQAPPSPRPSPAAGTRRSARVMPLTRERILKERREAFKKTRALAKKSGQSGEGIRIRGRWVSTPTRRQQDVGMGSAFDGSAGVDSEDINSIPQIGMTSFMLFPDQNSYGTDDPNLPPFNNTVEQGLQWIKTHTDSSRLFGKPVTMSGMGLVAQNNTQAFVPFNSTVAPFAGDSSPAFGPTQQQPFASQDQVNDAFSQWLQAGVLGGIQGMIQYQWSQTGLTTQPGTVISPISNDTTTSPVSNVPTRSGVSPNDGYGNQDVGALSQIVQQVGQGFVPDQNTQGTA